MNVLITGGTGYIGKSLTNGLSKKYNIISLTRKDLDLRNLEQMRKWFDDKYFDIVIHAAGVGGSRLRPEDQTVLVENVQIFNNLIFNKDKFKKLISFGSGAEIFNPNSFYGESKKIINHLINKENNFYNLRIFGVFDENELDTRFIKANIINYINKKSIEIYKNKVMDFFYMKDLIKLVEFYIEKNDPQKEINCSYREKYTLYSIAKIINSLSGYKVPIKFDDLSGTDIYCGKSELPIKTIGLEDGINNTYRQLL